MSDEMVEVTYNFGSIPPLTSFAGLQDVTLVTGVEDDPSGQVRIYLGHRYKGLYMLLPSDQGEQVRRSFGWSHLWMWPLPPAEAIFKEER